MSRNQVRTLWTVIAAAFVALFTALGLITTTAAAAVTRNEPARNSDPEGAESPEVTIPAQSPWSWTWSHARALPPTMKQRIRAEAHGTSPHCRHRPLADTASDTASDAPDASGASRDTPPRTEPALPLQR
ncbi:hypothetical protein JS756_04190 [Streptomyces actuosus]|uniref:Secreted protein n=1 Tax=Streptomyces actuosus TaxID=1885 RepID=A0ABS2VJP5_STRAS|nr:DUF6344 domain-containing protein [Streptomyces actuosus]MBN0043310.1 hypothetical protein [Streptomyces actuosus]